MQIPRIIHQTWKNEDVPAQFRQMASSWRDNHPDWEYRLWTDEMNRNFIREFYPFFLPRYDNYSVNIQRVDAVRYFLLHKYGGIYADLDFECLVNITPLIEGTTCVLGKEPVEHCLIHGKSMIISNAFMAAAPGHHFIRAICRELDIEKELTDHRNNHILESTGPFMLTALYEGYSRKEDIRLLDDRYIYPLTKDDLLLFNDTENPDRKMENKLKEAYAIHHYAGTWWKNVPA
jgi:inositol phosphorylceramide mannosyltransferase catalytic subunit